MALILPVYTDKEQCVTILQYNSKLYYKTALE